MSVFHIKPEYGGIPPKKTYIDHAVYMAICLYCKRKMNLTGRHLNRAAVIRCVCRPFAGPSVFTIGEPIMDIAAVAKQLDGAEYPLKISKELIEIMKKNRFVACYGASDDLLEFDGAIDDELGCWEGCEALIDKAGRVPFKDEVDLDDDEMVHRWGNRKRDARAVKALWNEGDQDNCPAWVIKTKIPHACFDIMEDGEAFSRGIVFSLDNLGN